MKVKIISSLKRMSVSIQIMPDASITVTVPSFFPRSKIDKILQEKEEWIRQRQQMIMERNAKRQGGEYLYLGKPYPLEIGAVQANIVELRDKLYLGSPNTKYASTYLTSWYKQQARKVIGERVYHYASIAGLAFKSISITSAETRWGSCSSEKTLNFNWRLIMAPLPVIDYVVAHELAHLTELNHSRAFWEKVRKMYPIYREYRTWLKRNGEMLRVQDPEGADKRLKKGLY